MQANFGPDQIDRGKLVLPRPWESSVPLDASMITTRNTPVGFPPAKRSDYIDAPYARDATNAYCIYTKYAFREY